MAQIETWLKCDLKKPVKVQYLHGNLFSQDNQANLIGVELYDNGAEVTASGTVTANIIREDGATVTATGSTSGNKASVVLPATAYAIPGAIAIIIKITLSGVITTIAAVVGTVYRSSTDTPVDPGTIMPSIQTLISQIQTAVASIPADYSSLWTSLAPAFSANTNYAAGQYVTNNGKVYRFNTAHAAGAWVASEVTEVKLGNEISDLNAALIHDGVPQYIKYAGTIINIAESFSSGDIVYIKAISSSRQDVTGYNVYAVNSSNTQTLLGKVNIGQEREFVLSANYVKLQIGTVPWSDNPSTFEVLYSNNKNGMIQRIIKRENEDDNIKASIAELKNSTKIKNLLPSKETVPDKNGIKLTNNGDGTYSIDGTSTAATTISFYYHATQYPVFLQPNKNYYIWNDIELVNCSMYIAKITNGTSTNVISSYKTTDIVKFTAPECDGMDIFVRIPNGVTIHETLSFNICEENEVLQNIYEIEKKNVLYKIIDRFQIENGLFETNSGKQDNAKRIRTQAAFHAKKGTILLFDIGTLYHQVFELSSSDTASGTNVLRKDTWNKETLYRAYNDSYIIIVFATSDSYNTSSDIVASDFNNHTITVIDDFADRSDSLITLKQITQADIVNRTFLSATGQAYDTKRLSTAQPIRVNKGTCLLFNTGGSAGLYHQIYELSSNSLMGDNAITIEGWSTDKTYTTLNDCYLLITFATSDTYQESSAISISDFLQEYDITIIGPNYLENRMIYDKATVEKVKEFAQLFTGGTDKESFLFFTDSHFIIHGRPAEEQEMEYGLKLMGDVYNMAPVDFCIYGGDIITNYMTDALYFIAQHDRMCKSVFGDNTYFAVAGNHEYNHYEEQYKIPVNDMVNIMFRKEGKTYYSKKMNHTTFYFLDTGENRNDDGTYNVPMDSYKWEQIDWLGNKLIEDDVTHSVIVMHIMQNNSEEYPEFQMFVEATELCSAYNSHSTITLNGITYDFTNCTGKVEFFLGGHMHRDTIFEKNGIICVIGGTTSFYHRNPSFHLVLCDWSNRKLYFKGFLDNLDHTISLE